MNIRVFTVFLRLLEFDAQQLHLVSSPKYKHEVRVDSFLVSGSICSGYSSVAGKVRLTLWTGIHPGVCETSSLEMCGSLSCESQSRLSCQSGLARFTLLALLLSFHFCPLGFWKKALEKVSVFRGALRRPEPDQNSGAGEARRGQPWDSRASEPARFRPRCL